MCCRFKRWCARPGYEIFPCSNPTPRSSGQPTAGLLVVSIKVSGAVICRSTQTLGFLQKESEGQGSRQVAHAKVGARRLFSSLRSGTLAARGEKQAVGSAGSPARLKIWRFAVRRWSEAEALMQVLRGQVRLLQIKGLARLEKPERLFMPKPKRTVNGGAARWFLQKLAAPLSAA